MGTHIFNSPYDQYDHLNGQEVTITKTIDVPDSTHDGEVLPMYEIVTDSGVTLEAWPEELKEKQ